MSTPGGKRVAGLQIIIWQSHAAYEDVVRFRYVVDLILFDSEYHGHFDL